jgi:hypothetical protein
MTEGPLLMTKYEVIKKLRALSRQSIDAAEAEEAVVAVFRPKFDEEFNDKTRDISRALELRYNALDRAAEAKRLRQEAFLFDEAANLIGFETISIK